MHGQDLQYAQKLLKIIQLKQNFRFWSKIDRYSCTFCVWLWPNESNISFQFGLLLYNQINQKDSFKKWSGIVCNLTCFLPFKAWKQNISNSVLASLSHSNHKLECISLWFYFTEQQKKAANICKEEGKYFVLLHFE